MGWNPWKSMKKFANNVGGEIRDWASGGVHSANKANLAIAREQMAFQERMSNTEVQRRVADYLAAGINPMLATEHSASAPSGASAEMRPEDKTRGISSALALKQQMAALENMNAQTAVLHENKLKVREETALLGSTALNVNQSTVRIEHEVQNLAQDFKRKQAELELTEEQLRTARLTNRQLEQLQPLLLEYQRLMNQAEQLGMTQRQVDQKFAEELGSESKYFRFIQQIFGTPRGDVR